MWKRRSSVECDWRVVGAGGSVSTQLASLVQTGSSAFTTICHNVPLGEAILRLWGSMTTGLIDRVLSTCCSTWTVRVLEWMAMALAVAFGCRGLEKNSKGLKIRNRWKDLVDSGVNSTSTPRLPLCTVDEAAKSALRISACHSP